MLKRHLKKTITIAVLLGAAFYLYWPGFGIDLPELPQNTVTFESYGNSDGAALNVVSIAPVMQPKDYASGQHFKAKLNAYFDEAKEKGWLNHNTIVLLPAHIGTPLLMTGHKSRVYNASSIDSAIVPIAARNLAAFAKNYYIFQSDEPILAAAIRAQSKIAAETYHIVFSAMAQNYGVTIVAGSIALMTPGIYPEGITYGHGPIFQTSFVYGPDGKPRIDAARQVEPSAVERRVIKPSLSEFLPVFTLNGIRYAVAIGKDATNQTVIDYLKSQNVELLLSPQFHTEGDNSINSPFALKPAFAWSVSSSMNGHGWGITAQGSAGYASSNDYLISQTSGKNAIMQNIWITP